jgi:hypothetical protein
MDKGFKGRDLGIKIKELEIEKFKEMLWLKTGKNLMRVTTLEDL